MRLTFNSHLPLLHSLQQGALRSRSGAVDFISQQQLGEYRPRMETKQAVATIKNGNTDNIRRQQIAGELDALIIEPQQFRQGMRQNSLANPGKILDQKMPARQQAGKRQANGLLFAKNNAPCLRDDLIQCRLHDHPVTSLFVM